MTSITAVESQNTARQPRPEATNSASGRASRMPVSRPAMMLPTVRPRRSGGTRCEANGTSTCAPVELMPITSEAMKNSAALRDSAARISAATRPTSVTITSRLFSTMSASETMRKRPMP